MIHECCPTINMKSHCQLLLLHISEKAYYLMRYHLLLSSLHKNSIYWNFNFFGIQMKNNFDYQHEDMKLKNDFPFSNALCSNWYVRMYKRYFPSTWWFFVDDQAAWNLSMIVDSRGVVSFNLTLVPRHSHLNQYNKSAINQLRNTITNCSSCLSCFYPIPSKSNFLLIIF